MIQNRDQWVTNFYDYGGIQNADQRKLFLQLAEQWYWESNHQICPINIFLKQEWNIFKQYLKVFISKDVTVIHGPVTSMSENMLKKIKRRSIMLVKQV